MKSIILFSLLLLPCLVLSQDISDYGSPEERATRMTDSLQLLLPLYEGQYDDFYQLNLKYAGIIQQEVIDKNLKSWSAYYKIYQINRRKEKELLPMMNIGQQENYGKLKDKAMKRLMARFF